VNDFPPAPSTVSSVAAPSPGIFLTYPLTLLQFTGRIKPTALQAFWASRVAFSTREFSRVGGAKPPPTALNCSWRYRDRSCLT